jgi:hypothetical protein
VVAPLDDQPGPPQDRQLLAQVARLDVDLVEELVNGMVALAEELEDADPGGVAEGPEEFRLGLVEGSGHPWLIRT